jgi:hypothetical protein
MVPRLCDVDVAVGVEREAVNHIEVAARAAAGSPPAPEHRSGPIDDGNGLQRGTAIHNRPSGPGDDCVTGGIDIDRGNKSLFTRGVDPELAHHRAARIEDTHGAGVDYPYVNEPPRVNCERCRAIGKGILPG